MRESPSFSVVIPVYNKQDHLADTLASVLAQTYLPKEIVVVNDGSTDKSEEIILGFQSPLIRYIKQENQGAAATRNNGIALAQEDYIALLDADDYWEENFLEEMVKAIREFPDEKVFVSAYKIETPHKKSTPPNYAFTLPEKNVVLDYFKASTKSSIIISSAVVIHKEVFETVGNFDETILSGQDTDLWIRIGLKYKVVFVPKFLSIYIYVPTSLSYSKVNFEQKLNVEKYKKQESVHLNLKKFMDLNRYALAVEALGRGDRETAKKMKADLDRKNLNQKQLFLLKLSPFGIRMMKRIKLFLSKFGMETTSF